MDVTQAEIGGGKTTISDLVQIESRPGATALRISGLDQNAFETFICRYGAQFSAISFWKCPRIVDLTPLEDLAELRLVVLYWNQRTTRLWNLRRTRSLVGLQFEDFTRLRDLADLHGGENLRELVFGDAIWRTSVFDSLSPLESLSSLQRLSIAPKRITDGRIEPLASLTSVVDLWFPRNLFTTSQVAWLRAHLPPSNSSDVLAPIVHLGARAIGEGDQSRDVLVVGKGKPALASHKDGARIQRYVAAFEELVEEYRRDPSLPPS